MYKIIASDLDGTLLTSEHKILPFTKQILTQLHQQGKQFVFATGRHHVDVGKMRDKLGIPAYMITSNGACVHNSNNEIIFQQYMSTDIVREVLKLVQIDQDILINIFRKDDWLVNRKEEILKFGKGHFTYDFFDINNPPLEDVVKLFFIREDKNHEKLVVWEDKIKAIFGDKVNITFSAPFCLEVMAAGVSKGHALDEIAQMLGAQLNDCIAFGDGMNDVEMLTMAGKGLVMGSAHHKVKSALPNNDVIGCCNDQAVAHYLEDHVLE
jgi:Cof subfamily protein (haloacid dehalogenase superfamily)